MRWSQFNPGTMAMSMTLMLTGLPVALADPVMQLQNLTFADGAMSADILA